MPGFIITKPVFDLLDELEAVSVRPSECENLWNNSSWHPEHKHRCGHRPCWDLRELKEDKRDGPCLDYCASFHHSLDHAHIFDGEPYTRKDMLSPGPDEKVVYPADGGPGYIDVKQPGDADVEINL